MDFLFTWVEGIIATFDWVDVISQNPDYQCIYQIMLGCTACAILVIGVKTIAKAILKLFD